MRPRHKPTPIPTLRAVTTPTPPSERRALPIPELIGLLLLVVGVAGLVVVAFLLHPLAGGAVLSALAAVAGYWLTTREV